MWLGFEKIPFKNNSIDYLTAYDLLEHIPGTQNCLIKIILLLFF